MLTALALCLLAFPPDDDPTVWPNRWSRANSDPWIVEHHDRIRKMRPKLLVLNFANAMPAGQIEVQTRALIAALAESSRWHGWADPKAPVFLEYDVFKTVDLRDEGRKDGNSSKSPIKPDVKEGVNMDYGALFNDTFARHYAVPDPDRPKRFLRLDELLDRGLVHEVWFFATASGDLRCLECVEEKPLYDEQFRRIPGEFRQAGNGGDPDQKWTGRSVRINCLNWERGIGCAMENLGHCLEGMAHSKVIPYYTKYFHEFAGFDLDRRWKLPFDSFYPLWGEDKGIEYPGPRTAVVRDGKKSWTIENYLAIGGNAHFPPNARRHYDLDGPDPVMSTIEDWRIGSGPDGADLAKPWTPKVLEPFRKLAPDCMGAWLVYWRQNMPGLDNRQKADGGRPMKNWWPFLFY